MLSNKNKGILEKIFSLSKSIYKLHKKIIFSDLNNEEKEKYIFSLKEALEIEKEYYESLNINRNDVFDVSEWETQKIFENRYVCEDALISSQIKNDNQDTIDNFVFIRMHNILDTLTHPLHFYNIEIGNGDNTKVFNREESKKILKYELFTNALLRINDIIIKNLFDNNILMQRQLWIIFLNEDVERMYIANRCEINENIVINFQEFFDISNYSYSSHYEQENIYFSSLFRKLMEKLEKCNDSDLNDPVLKEKFEFIKIMYNIAKEYCSGREEKEIKEAFEELDKKKKLLIHFKNKDKIIEAL